MAGHLHRGLEPQMLLKGMQARVALPEFLFSAWQKRPQEARKVPLFTEKIHGEPLVKQQEMILALRAASERLKAEEVLAFLEKFLQFFDLYVKPVVQDSHAGPSYAWVEEVAKGTLEEVQAMADRRAKRSSKEIESESEPEQVEQSLPDGEDDIFDVDQDWEVDTAASRKRPRDEAQETELPPAKRRLRKLGDMANDDDTSMAETVLVLSEDEDDILLSQEAAKSIAVLEESADEDEEDEEDADAESFLTDDVRATLTEMREALVDSVMSQDSQDVFQSQTERRDPVKAMADYMQRHQEYLEEICQHVDMAALDEATYAALATRLFGTDGKENPEALMGSLECERCIMYVIFPRISAMEASASRLLFTFLLKLAHVYPKQVLNGLLVPLIKDTALSPLGAPQSEILNRLIKEGLAARAKELVYDFLREALAEASHLSRKWNELYVNMLANVLNLKLALPEDVIALLVFAFKQHVTQFSKSIKFTNLIFLAIGKYPEMVRPHASVLRLVLEQTDSFMTKVALDKLARIESAS